MPAELRTEHNAAWKECFRLPAIYNLQIAREDVTRGILNSTMSGTSHIYAWHAPTGELRCLTENSDGVWFGLLSPDGDSIYYLADRQGDEIGHIVRVPYDGGTPEDITPDLAPYTVPFESNVFGLSCSQDGTTLGLSTATEDGFHFYIMTRHAASGHSVPRNIYNAGKLFVGPSVSYGGELAVLASTENGVGMQYSLLAFDTASGQSAGMLHDDAGSILPIMFSPCAGDMRLLAMTNASGYHRPLIWNPHTGERRDIALQELAGDVSPYDWSGDGKRILLKQFWQAAPQLYIYDLEHDDLLRLQHPAYGDISSVCFGPEGVIYAICEDSTHPAQIMALDDTTGSTRSVLLATATPPLCYPLRSVTFPSSDGIPEGEGPFPTILHVHGGPDIVATGGYWDGAQAMLDHGFAFLSVNYRGSVSFGKAFQEQIWGDIGHWEVEDMVAARTWLVDQGIAHPRQIFLKGMSYGGYLTLLALGTYPDLWAGGMAGVAIADCVINWEDEAQTSKAFDATLFKGTPTEQPELYRRASPVTYAEQVQAPILIIQGRNDTRCPSRQIEVYEAKMKALGKDIEVYWFDAGHVSTDVEQQIAHQERNMRFVYRVLGLM
jgi:dienelactone hydrolase/Tol biopolymer transport system component